MVQNMFFALRLQDIPWSGVFKHILTLKKHSGRTDEPLPADFESY